MPSLLLCGVFIGVLGRIAWAEYELAYCDDDRGDHHPIRRRHRLAAGLAGQRQSSLDTGLHRRQHSLSLPCLV